MTSRVFLVAVISVVVLGVFPVHGEELQAGTASIDITPPVGFRMCGYFYERLCTGTHDPLHAKAIVFKQGRESAALVFCDLIGLPLNVSTAARERASKQTGIPAANILVAGTHSHTGPLFFGPKRNRWHRLAVEREGKDPHEPFDYAEFLEEKIATAIVQAAKATRPVGLETMKFPLHGLSFNRRFHMKSGPPVRFNPGKMNPDILRVAGPIDPDVGFLLARDPGSKKNLFSLSVFALHLDTTGGTEWSADYPFYLENTLRKSLGEDLLSVFGVGACGDINHVDVSNKERQKGGVEAQRIGTTLGESIIAALDGLAPVGEPCLAARSATVHVPLQGYTPEELKEARTVMNKADTERVPFLELVDACRVAKLALRNTDKLAWDVQVFRLNKDTAIVGLPGEIFVELGLAIKNASPFANTYVVELANACPAYIPTRKAMAEGSYETVNCIIKPGGGEMLAAAAVQLLCELDTENPMTRPGSASDPRAWVRKGNRIRAKAL